MNLCFLPHLVLMSPENYLYQVVELNDYPEQAIGRLTRFYQLLKVQIGARFIESVKTFLLCCLMPRFLLFSMFWRFSLFLFFCTLNQREKRGKTTNLQVAWKIPFILNFKTLQQFKTIFTEVPRKMFIMLDPYTDTFYHKVFC